MIEWQWSRFSELTADDVYQLAKVRQDVFINEQQCFYSDLDNIDQTAWHLLAWKSNTLDIHSEKKPEKKLVAYLRVIEPNEQYMEVVVGRFLVIQKERGRGIAKVMLAKVLEKIKADFPEKNVKIAAQTYLEGFYETFGFKGISAPYLEDGIMHIDMIRP